MRGLCFIRNTPFALMASSVLHRSVESAAESCCSVVELRQYTLHPGQRDTLIELVEREFVESQEALGMRIIGQFRDLDKPDRFVWLRGFPDMEARDAALRAFYGGPVWAAHRATANATMIDASNVLLLRLARADSGFRVDGLDRAPIGATQCSEHVIVATICYLSAPRQDAPDALRASPTGGEPGLGRPCAGQAFIDSFEDSILPALADAGAAIVGAFATEGSENTFPVLPVRDESVFVWFSAFRNSTHYESHRAQLEASRHWREEIHPSLRARLVSDPEILRLSPTARSLLT